MTVHSSFRLLRKEAQRDASARITPSELLAKAAQLESHGVLTFERLVASRVNGRRMLRKEAERDAGSQDHDDLAKG